MIDLYYWTTPNGHKVTILLEELGIDYNIVPININNGDQFGAEFLKISPNNRIPAIVDHAPQNGGGSLSVFESGAILQYLGEKTGSFLPSDLPGRVQVLEWLFWQVGGLGPMAGQNGHFTNTAPSKIAYAIDRYQRETARLYTVLDKRLSDLSYIAGEYSIADMACYPWIVPYRRHGMELDEYPGLARWFRKIEARPAVERAYARAKDVNPNAGQPLSSEARKILYER